MCILTLYVYREDREIVTKTYRYKDTATATAKERAEAMLNMTQKMWKENLVDYTLEEV